MGTKVFQVIVFFLNLSLIKIQEFSRCPEDLSQYDFHILDFKLVCNKSGFQFWIKLTLVNKWLNLEKVFPIFTLI